MYTSRILIQAISEVSVVMAVKIEQASIDGFVRRARMVAMMRATASADRVGKSLSLRHNCARQDHITTELMDIIGATEAFRNR